MSIYIEENIFTFEGNKYEALFNHPEEINYRVILSDDDYDYIEDERMIAILNAEYFIHSFGEEFMNSNDKGTKKMY